MPPAYHPVIELSPRVASLLPLGTPSREDPEVMRHITTRALTTIAAIALIATTFSGSTALASDEDGNGAVFTQTNAASGNAVLMFRRAAGGTLVPAGSYATGGSG